MSIEVQSERERSRMTFFYIRNLSHDAWRDRKNLPEICKRIEAYAQMEYDLIGAELARAEVPSPPAATMPTSKIEPWIEKLAEAIYWSDDKRRSSVSWANIQDLANLITQHVMQAVLAASVPAADLERKNELLIQTIESLRAASVPQTAPEPKLGFREWLCQGGGGHEDGEDGIRACTLPLNSAIEMVDDYLEYLREPERRKAIDGEGK